MKWFDLRRLDGYLPPDLEKAYRLYYLKDDIKVAGVTMLLLCLLLVVFAFNDYLLFGFSPIFYFLISLRNAYLVYFIFLMGYLRRLGDPRKYDMQLFIWLMLSMAMVIVINLTRPASYTGYLVIDVILVLLVYLAMPMPILLRSMGAILFTLGDIFIFYVLRHASSPAIAYASIMALVMANIGGMYTSGRLYSFRRNAFRAGIEEANSREELQRNRDMLNDTGEMARVGGWELDVATSRQVWTDEVYRIHEVELDYQPTLENGISFYAPEAIPVISGAVQESIDSGKPFDAELPFITAKGNHLWVRAIGQPHSKDGKVIKVVGTFQDITERKLAEEKIKMESAQWQTTFDAITDFVSIQDRDFRLVRVNKAYADAFKDIPGGLIGRHCYNVVHDTDCPIENCPHLQVLQTKRPAAEEVFEPRLGICLEISCSPIFNQSGEIEGSVHIAKDITERKKVEEEQQRAAQEISDLYNKAPSGYHSLDKDGFYVRINDTELTWLGYTREEIVGKKKFSDVITPESLEKFKIEFPGFKERGWVRDLEFDIVRKDGTVMPILLSATAIKDESGNYLMSRSTVFDITEIKRLRDVVTESEKKYRTILEEMHDAYLEVDLAGNYTFLNSRICEMLLYSREELMGMNFRSIVAEEDIKDIFAAYNKVFSTGEPNKGVVMKAVRKDGTTWYAECSISPVKNQKDRIIGFRSVARDVSERVELQKKLAQMAMHDGLTGLPNRVLLNDRFEMAVARAQRNKKKLTVMILDLDKFKLVNDTLGHGTGDGLLKSVATRLSMMVRKSDTVARIGGDEFAVLLPETSLARDAMSTAQKIVKAFSRSFTVDGHDLNVTTSIGIAVYPDNGEDMEELLKEADSAMYYAKEHGRNGYKLAGD